ncbi:hypothetical protein C8Q77DRAFT_1135342 [Trametes polyzona]|nr:hypothetical protein C8Q77DRAFT_1135342 [Trametes polyzona]
MAPFSCSICQELYRLEKLRCLPCGHTFCDECVTRLVEVSRQDARSRARARPPLPTCPSCRKPFKSSDPHPIYIDLADPESQDAAPAPAPCHAEVVHTRIQRATEEVELVERDPRYQTVQKAVRGVENVAALFEGQQECLLGLLSAVAARWRGMSTAHESQKRELAKVREQLMKVEDERDGAVAATSRAEKIAMEAVQTTEHAHKAFRDSQSEVAALRDQVERLKREHQKELDDKRERLKRLFASLDALKEKEAKQKKEIERLRAEAEESAELLRSSAAEQLISLEVEDDFDQQGSGAPSEGAQRTYDMSGSQATFERLPDPGASRKRKGSEEDLPVNDAGWESEREEATSRAYHGPPQQQHHKRVLKPAVPKPSAFTSDWKLSSEQLKLKGAPRTLQRCASATSFPIKMDPSGKPLKPVHAGSRKRLRKDT